VGENKSLRAELAGIYYHAIQAPARRWLPVPVGALFGQDTVIHMPGLTLVYAPDAPNYGNLIMSHSEVGAGTDDLGNQHRDGDTAYRDAFTRATPSGRMGRAVPDANSGSLPPRPAHRTTSLLRYPQDSDTCRRDLLLARGEELL
jgi:hypothetical protein